MNRCCICTKDIIGSTWFCNKCAKTYNLIKKGYSDWPSWVKALKYLEKQRREKRNEMLNAGFTQVNYGTIEDLELLIDSGVISAS